MSEDFKNIRAESENHGTYVTYTWDLTANSIGVDKLGFGIFCAEEKRCSIQVQGDFEGATLEIEGSNDALNFVSLDDPNGVNIVVRTDDIKILDPAVLRIRPVVKGGDEKTKLHVILFLGR